MAEDTRFVADFDRAVAYERSTEQPAQVNMASLPLSPRRRRRPGSHWQVLAALFLRDAAGEGSQVLGLIRRLVEPAIMIFATIALAWLINRRPPYGPSMLLWSVTGVAPIYVFVRIARTLSVQWNMGLPFHTDLDLCLVHALLEFLFVTGAGFLLFSVLYVTQTEAAMPSDWAQAAKGWFAMAGLGIGVGLISRILWRLFRFWQVAFPSLLRGTLHLSGVYFVVDYLPPQISYWLWFNPIIHCVTMFRLGFYPTFPTYVYSPAYLLCWVFATVAIGITAVVLLGDRINL